MQVELIERAMRGDRDAFASIAASSVDRCYAIAYRILRDPHRAQDASQQALLGAWRDLHTLRDASKFDAWLHRLVVHACYVEARGERRWVARGRIVALRPEHAPDIGQAVVVQDQLDGAFRELTPEHRAVVVLHHYLGYSLIDIAQMLGVPAGTVRSRMHHALRKLRMVLEAGDAESGSARGASA